MLNSWFGRREDVGRRLVKVVELLREGEKPALGQRYMKMSSALTRGVWTSFRRRSCKPQNL